MNSKHHKSDSFQVAIQLLVVTTKEMYMGTQVVFLEIYIRIYIYLNLKPQKFEMCVD